MMNNGNELKVMMAAELLEGFIGANTKDDQRLLAMSGAYALSENFHGFAIVNLSRNRRYSMFRDGETLVLENVGGQMYTFPLGQAKKFICALGMYADTDFADTKRRYTYRNKMVSAIAG